jgi:hypothetical protein
MPTAQVAQQSTQHEPAQRPPLWAYADPEVLAKLAIENNGNN